MGAPRYRLEGINSTIKVIKRKAYGFHDDRCFTLKVKQASDQEDVTQIAREPYLDASLRSP